MVRKAIQMARKKANIDIPNLRGKLALVTGASDGLGLEIARRLALAGAEVILPVRNPKKGAAAVDRIALCGRCTSSARCCRVKAARSTSG